MSQHDVIYEYLRPMRYGCSKAGSHTLFIQVTEDVSYTASPQQYRNLEGELDKTDGRYKLLIELRKNYLNDYGGASLREHLQVYYLDEFPEAEKIKWFVEKTVEEFIQSEKKERDRRNELKKIDEVLDSWDADFSHLF